ncbi:aminotransferase-like domain-containing protein [[Eubacterium] cellulosolvens]
MESLYSRRAKGLKASEIRELLKLTQQPDIISFAGGLPNPVTFPYDELKEISAEVIKNHGQLALQYGTTEGHVPLREQIAEWMNKRYKIAIDESNILITSGSQQGLMILGYLMLNSNDTVIVSNPTYLGGIGAFNAFRGNMETIPLDNDGMVIDHLEEALIRLDRNKIPVKFIYLIPTFQNPTGVTLSEERRKRVMDLSEAYDTMILSDNPYSELRYKGTPLTPLITMDEDNRVVYLGTFSKILVPGLRIAWMVGSQEFIKKCTICKQSIDLCTNPFNQYIVAEFMSRGLLDPHIQKICEIYKEKMDIMLKAMDEFFPKEVQWTQPEGGLFTWVTCPEHVNTRELFETAIIEKVAYVIGGAFFPNGGGDNTMRVNFSHPTNEKISEGVRRLGNVLENAIAEPVAKEVITGV